MATTTKKSRDMLNIILFSISFMLLFTALVTTGNIVQIILRGVHKEDPSFSGDGYISLAIVYACFCIANLFAPSLISLLKTKWTLVWCSCFYVIYIANLMVTSTWSLYLSSALLGLAAAGLWTSHGNYLTLCSTPKTISRNMGIFWVFFCSSQFFGNGFVFWQFFGKEEIDSGTRFIVLGFLTGIGMIAVVCFCFLEDLENFEDENKTESFTAFSSALKLFQKPQMLLLIFSFLFLGTNQSFFASVYPTAIGFTKQFGPVAKSLAGLSGIFTGIGGFIGGGIVLFLGQIINSKVGKYPLIVTGAGILVFSYALIYFNIPDVAPLMETENISHFNPPSPVIGMFCAFLLGLGDSLIHTQVYGTLSTVWRSNSAGAFAILHFFKSCAVSFQFVLSSKQGLIWQLTTLIIFCIIAAIAFVVAEVIIKFRETEKVVENSSKSDVENLKMSEVEL